MKRWMSFAALIVAALIVVAPTFARTADLTDHWWDPNEAGWGLSVTQQEEVAFAVLFVYDRNGTPTWLTAAATRVGIDASGNPAYAGPLYRHTGPWFGGAFDRTLVQGREVGTFSFETGSDATAVVRYQVDGATVVKSVRRFDVRAHDWSGLYRAVQRAVHRSCDTGYTPPFIYDDGLLEVRHEGASITLTFDGGKSVCTYSGTYRQRGRVADVAGTYACTDGVSGTFTLAGLETSQSGFSARMESTHPRCSAVRQDVAGFLLN